MAKEGASDTPLQIRALLIEDDPNDRLFFIREFLRCAPGATLETKDSVSSAVQWIDSIAEPPNVIFIDLHLPGDSVPEFLRLIRAEKKFAKILLFAITGDLSCACANPSEFGVHALLVKPIASADLDSLLLFARARLR